MKTIYRLINPAPRVIILETLAKTLPSEARFFVKNGQPYTMVENQCFIFESEPWLEGAQIVFFYNVTREEAIRVARRMGDCLLHEYNPNNTAKEDVYEDLTGELI